MTISISNLTINNNAPAGTVVGVLTARDASGTVIPCNFTLTKNSAGFLAISGDSLVTAFSGSILAGNYSVRVHANGTNTRFSGNAVFNISVNIATPPPPPPITLPNGTYIISLGSNSVDGGFGYFGIVPFVQLNPTNSGTGQQWVWNGSLFRNVAVAGGGSSGASGPYMADNGDGTVTENATGDGWTVSSSGNGYTVRNNRTGRYLSIVSNVLAMSSTQTVWTISAPPSPSPTAITLSPVGATVPDNAPAGTLLATAKVTMSDGSQFAGTLTTSDTNFFTISGSNIVTARAFTSADDGARSTVITASQGSQSFSMEFSV